MQSLEQQEQQRAAEQGKQPTATEQQGVVHRRFRLAAELDDGRRVVQRLWRSPSGRYVAAADTLGRVLVVDTVAGCLAVRLFKGYRNAVCVWCRRPRASTTDTAAEEAARGMSELENVYLAIHTPLREILDVWEVLHTAEPKARIAMAKDEVIATGESSAAADTGVVVLWSTANDTLRCIDVVRACCDHKTG